MCALCTLFGLQQHIEYVEVSPVIMQDSTVTVFGMTVPTPPCMVVLSTWVSNLQPIPPLKLGVLLYN